MEQREYVEFANARLEARMEERFERLRAEIIGRLDRSDERSARVERKLEQFIDRHR